MHTKYGDISSNQVSSQKQKLHNSVHWLLVYKEQDYKELDKYFDSLLFKISGLNSLLSYPDKLIDLMSLLEGARIELGKPNFNFTLYRKAILDAHTIIDTIFAEEDSNA